MEIMRTNDEDSRRATGVGKACGHQRKKKEVVTLSKSYRLPASNCLRTKGTLSDNQIEAFGFKLHPANSHRDVV